MLNILFAYLHNNDSTYLDFVMNSIRNMECNLTENTTICLKNKV